jgi:hypothetical protein
MKNELVAPGHIKSIIYNLEKSVKLLTDGRNVVPYDDWSMKISEVLDEIKDHLAQLD